MRSRRVASLAALAAGVSALGLGQLAHGREWQQSISIPIMAEYDSNPLLLGTDAKGIGRWKVVPAYNFTATYGVDEFNAGLGLSVERSTDQLISTDREDPRLSLRWQRSTPKGGYGLLARYDEASSRYSELADNGVRVADGTRTTQSIAGNWSTALGERSTLSADAEYKDVAYDRGALSDYTNSTVGLAYSFARSERIEPFARASFSRFDPANGPAVSSGTTGLLGGVKWKVSENLLWTGQAGAYRTSAETADTGWQGSFGFRYIGPNYDASLDIGRYVQASSAQGGFSEADQVTGTFAYAISERTRVGVVASWRDSMGINPNTMGQVGFWANHQLSPFWDVRLIYLFKQRQQEGLPDASANVVTLTFIYTHPDF